MKLIMTEFLDNIFLDSIESLQYLYIYFIKELLLKIIF